ncbi:Ger(x)C family spore germination protein [Clostridium sp. WILCCON 0269]|uniref:Ger(X)C family spore germination protein n=1 Tax=Candidatus Clostridium eludens TaxID=3381663 RepID=A0ABW8SIE2_9CLOT
MKNNTKKYICILLLCVGITVFFSTGLKQQQPVEELDIISGLGADLKIEDSQVDHIIPMSVYLFEPKEKVESILRTGTAKTKGETRQNRQLSDDKQNILGLEKVFIISEDQAIYGLKDWTDILFRNPYLNDTAYTAVCKGKASDILGTKLRDYPSSADFIEGLIKNSVFHNFFSDGYRVMNLFLSIGSEGYNPVLPYIELTNGGIEITGMTLFNHDRMVSKISVDELRFMNIMRENNVKGILTLQKTPDKYINYYATSKRKVSCTKTGDRYKFTIDISLEGDLITDTLYKDLQKDSKKNAEFNRDMSQEVKKKCNDFISKMKNNYKVDCLQLGKFAAAKYGRHTGKDWNSIVCNSKIDVNVKVQIKKTGRGDY